MKEVDRDRPLAEKSRAAHYRQTRCPFFASSHSQFGRIDGEAIGQIRRLVWAELNVGEHLSCAVFNLYGYFLIFVLDPCADDGRLLARDTLLFHRLRALTHNFRA